VNVLRLVGEVGGPGFNHRQVVDHLRDAGPVRLIIASSGGNADHAHAIHAALRGHPDPVTAVIEYAGSAATVAAMGAGRRALYHTGHFFLHGSWIAAVGNAASLARAAARLAEHDALAAAVYAEATGLPAERIRELLADETTLTARQCLELGFVHELVPGDAEPAPDVTWAQTAEQVARMALAAHDATPETIERRAEGTYQAVMRSPLQPPPAEPDSTAEDLAETKRRHRDLFMRTQRSLLRSLATGAPYRPVAPYWRCTCGARNYTPPAVAGRPSLCHQCERQT